MYVHMFIDEVLGIASIGADVAFESRSRDRVLSRVNLTTVASRKPLITMFAFESASHSKT